MIVTRDTLRAHLTSKGEPDRPPEPARISYQMKRWSAVMASTALLACSGPDTPSMWEGAIRDSAGVTIVANPAEGLWEEGEGWTVRQELTIGNATGDSSYQFGGIVSVVGASDGSIFVLDGQSASISVYTKLGIFERRFGGLGQGPGELTGSAWPILILPGDTIVVYDSGNQRVNRYDREGTLVGSRPLTGFGRVWGLVSAVPTPAGRIVVHRQFADLTGRAVRDPMELISWSKSDGSIQDTILRVPGGKSITLADGGGYRQILFAAGPRWAMSGDSTLIYGQTSRYQFGLYDSHGSLHRLISKPFARQPVSNRDKELSWRAYQNWNTTMGRSVMPIDVVKERISFADSFPSFYEIAVGREQTIWVRRIHSPSQLPEAAREYFHPWRGLGSPEWDVFDHEGFYLGVVQLPERFNPTHIAGDEIYGIWRDDLDVQYVMRLRVVDAGA